MQNAGIPFYKTCLIQLKNQYICHRKIKHGIAVFEEKWNDDV